MLEFLDKFYRHIRNALLWFAIYFIVQALIWVALAILIWFYPQSLFLLVVIFFSVLALVSLYFGVVFLGFLLKVKKIKGYLK
jgi:hypothetical protein